MFVVLLMVRIHVNGEVEEEKEAVRRLSRVGDSIMVSQWCEIHP